MNTHFARPLIERGVPVKPWVCAECGARIERTNGPGMGATFRHLFKPAWLDRLQAKDMTGRLA